MMISLSCLRFGVFVKRYRLLLEKLKFIFPISNIKIQNIIIKWRIQQV